jgi:hypothetical protein
MAADFCTFPALVPALKNPTVFASYVRTEWLKYVNESFE